VFGALHRRQAAALRAVRRALPARARAAGKPPLPIGLHSLAFAAGPMRKRWRSSGRTTGSSSSGRRASADGGGWLMAIAVAEDSLDAGRGRTRRHGTATL